MASVYPGALDTFLTNKNDLTGQGSNDHAGHHNNLADAINKIEAELGINPSGASATVVARFATLQAISEKGVANGYAALDGTGKVPSAQLPTIQSIPTGGVMAFAGTGAPTGFLLCDGAAVSRTTYSALWTLLGTLYGAGDGSTTFNLPDYRGRSLVGLGTHADVDALTDTDGQVVGNRRPKHSHTGTVSHAGSGGVGSGVGVYGNNNATPTGTSGGINVGVGPMVDSGGYAVVGWIIKT